MALSRRTFLSAAMPVRPARFDPLRPYLRARVGLGCVVGLEAVLRGSEAFSEPLMWTPLTCRQYSRWCAGFARALTDAELRLHAEPGARRVGKAGGRTLSSGG